MCCWFHQVSSHLVKILFYSFHFQSKCCPNYIILIPSLSCFNRSVVSIIPLLTGVSSKCFYFAKFIFLPSFSNHNVIVIDLYRSLYISFLLQCLHVRLVHCNPFLMSFNLQGSSNVPCSSFLTECFQPRSSSLYSFLEICSTSRGSFGFTNLSKKQLSFTSYLPLPFSPVPS